MKFDLNNGFIVDDFETIYATKAQQRKSVFNTEIDTTEGSVYSIIDSVHSEAEQQLQLQLQDLDTTIQEYFNTLSNRIQSSIVCTNQGIKQATLSAGATDCTIDFNLDENNKQIPGDVYITIVDTVDPDSSDPTSETVIQQNLAIATAIHNSAPVYLLTNGDVRVNVTANNNQIMTYKFSRPSIANTKLWYVYLSITYYQSTDETFGFNVEDDIRTILQNVIDNTGYNKLGKNIEYQDFLSIISVNGVARADIAYAKIQEKDGQGNILVPAPGDYIPLVNDIEVTLRELYLLDVNRITLALGSGS